MGQRSSARASLVIVVVAAGLAACAPERTLESRQIDSGAVIEDFPVGSTSVSPWGITVGRDGAIWFTEARGNKIGRIDPKNPASVHEFPIPTPESEPRSIATSPDGAIWFFESKTRKLARMETAPPYRVQEFLTPSRQTYVHGMAADASEGVWFTGDRHIGRIAARPPHVMTETFVSGYPMDITIGPDSDVWFSMQSWNSVGHIQRRSPEEVELFEVAAPECHKTKIVSGRGGDVWFLDATCRTFGRFGVRSPHPVKEFEFSRSLPTMVDLAVARDGSVWLLSQDAVFRCQTEPPYAFVRFPIPTAGSEPREMVVGPDGNLWFTESGTDRIGRVLLDRARRRPPADPPTVEMVAQAQPQYQAKLRPPLLTSINLWSDLECVVTIDGVEKGRLRRRDGDVFLVPPGRHLVTAIETGSGRSWARVFDVSAGQGVVAQILFTPEIEEEALGFTPDDPGIAFVAIAPGEFWMGDDHLQFGQAGPRHRVRITRQFEIGKDLVTQGQWKRAMNRNPTPWEYEGDDRPVVNVSWDETQEFLRRLGDMNRYHQYRLPTEAEWEYACRAGNESDALERDESVLSSFGLRRTPPKRANRWGLYDLGGTTSEWCQDWHAIEYYRVSPLDDPPGPRFGSNKVVKGGNFGSDVSGLRPAQRAFFPPYNRSVSVGFRVVRVLR